MAFFILLLMFLFSIYGLYWFLKNCVILYKDKKSRKNKTVPVSKVEPVAEYYVDKDVFTSSDAGDENK